MLRQLFKIEPVKQKQLIQNKSEALTTLMGMAANKLFVESRWLVSASSVFPPCVTERERGAIVVSWPRGWEQEE